VATPIEYARRALEVLVHDREERLLRIDEYLRGEQDQPYMPESADHEYKMLAERSITNVMGFIVGTPAQAMYVDSFRKGRSSDDVAGQSASTAAVQPEWDHWQKSRLDARQAAVYRAALGFGHSFVLTEKISSGVRSKGLSPLRTTALYEDPANDDAPVVAIHVTQWPTGSGDTIRPGRARMWDAKKEYAVTFKSTADLSKGVTCNAGKAHGADECPVTRFAAVIDLEGRTWGVVEPMIPLQNRINQTVFDLLIVQSFASFKVRTISGMAPPIKRKGLDAEGNETTDPEQIVEWVPVLDSNGNVVPEDINLSARRVFWAEDEDTKFGTLDETPLNGFIEAIELAFRHIASLSQTPPHHLLGQIANLSAEALVAAETALSRRVAEFRSAFGESWERVFRIAAQLGAGDGADDYAGEVVWRDMEQRSLAQAGDALGKLAESLGIPKRGLWARVPGVTATELGTWEAMYEEESPDLALARAATRAAPARPQFRQAAETVA
jgi:hypothetical protein